jgi:hypothetical protein
VPEAQFGAPKKSIASTNKNSNKKGGQSAQLLTTYNSDHTNNLPRERHAVEENLWLPAKIAFTLFAPNELKLLNSQT